MHIFMGVAHELVRDFQVFMKCITNGKRFYNDNNESSLGILLQLNHEGYYGHLHSKRDKRGISTKHIGYFCHFASVFLL